MTMTKEKITPAFDKVALQTLLHSETVQKLALECTLRKHQAAQLREQVNKVAKATLEEVPLYRRLTQERINNLQGTHSAARDDFKQFYRIFENALKVAGINPATMAYGRCPALVSERQLWLAQKRLIDILAPALNLTVDDIVYDDKHCAEFLNININTILGTIAKDKKAQWTEQITLCVATTT